jgi:lysozyme
MQTRHAIRSGIAKGAAWVLVACAGFLYGCAEDYAAGDQYYELETRALPVHTACGGGSTVAGIDVSHWQGAIDWNQVAATDVRFAYMKATQDSEFVDTRFARNWSEARRVGLLRGAYHYLDPAYDGRAQAEHFVATVRSAGGWQAGDLPPMVDVETTSGMSAATVRSRLQAFLEYVEGQVGKRPILYTGSYFWDDNGLGSGFTGYPLWTAHYTANSCPLVPDAWSAWKIWQYTSSGRVTGIAGNVDRDRFNGTYAELQQWAGGGGSWTPINVNQTYSGSVSLGQEKRYSFARTNGRTYTVTLHPTSGDPDLYTSRYATLSRSSYQCASGNGAGTDDVCAFTATDSGTNYVLVYGFSAASYTLRVTESAPAPPAVPTGVAATDGTYSTMVRITWSAAAGATGYTVYRSTSDGSYGSAIATTSAASYDDTSATPGTYYYYRVRASNAAGTSGYSAADRGYRATSQGWTALSLNRTYSGTVAQGQTKGYTFARANGRRYVVTLTPMSGDPDLYTSKYSNLSTTQYQCGSTNGSGQSDVCSFTATDSGTNYVLVYGYSTASYTIRISEQ